MDEEIERLIVSVRADTAGFARDVAEMRGSLEGPMEAGAHRAGRAIEGALLRAVRTGKLGFDDLAKVALSVMDEIAKAALRGGIAAVTGQAGGLGGVLAGLIGGMAGAPGRATGGPVSPMRPYWVGERGPELFVPASAGQVAAPGGGAREVRVAITVNAGGSDAPRALAHRPSLQR
ncbi:MAG: tail tape measure protein [Acetobacteraceae bacterium]|nr:MAG: tail tape measure protein [Acetobacteraceae bacterium]